MGKELPYFPFYPKDFAADGKVEAMTTLEVGAYMLLLCKAWHETPPCSVPDDDFVLARWARLTEAEWSQARTRVRACWQLRDGRLYQPRLEAEYRNIAGRANKNGKAAKTRWDRMRSQCNRNANAFQSQCHSDSDSESDSNIVVSQETATDDDDVRLRLLTERPEGRKRPMSRQDAQKLLERLNPSEDRVRAAVRVSDHVKPKNWARYVITCIENGCELTPALAEQDTKATRNRDHVVRMIEWAVREGMAAEAAHVQAWFNAMTGEEKSKCLTADHRDCGGDDGRRWRVLLARSGYLSKEATA